MRRLARETDLETRNVISQATNNLPDFAAVQMPNLPNLKRTVRRIHQQVDPNRRIQPASLQELEIPDSLVELDNGDSFLLYDSGPDTGNRRYFKGKQCFACVSPKIVFYHFFSDS